jgi:hypothetical protein
MDFGDEWKCMPQEACLGDNGYGTPICNEGYAQSDTNVRCALCETDPANRHYKEAGTHICQKCPENQWVWGLVFMIFFLLILIFGVIPGMYWFLAKMMGLSAPLPRIWRYSCGVFALCCIPLGLLVKAVYSCFKKIFSLIGRVSARTRCRYDDILFEKATQIEARMRKAPLMRSLAMCMNYSQTLYAFAMLELVPWPSESWFLLSWTKLLTMDLDFFKPDCIVPLPYFTKWIGKLIMPYFMVALLVLTTLFSVKEVKKNAGGELKSAHFSIWRGFMFTLAVLIHVLNIFHLKVVLSTVDCNYCRKGVKCLDEFTLVECFTFEDSTWVSMMVISLIDFCLFAGSWPFFLGWVLWRSWKMSKSEESVPKKKQWIPSFAAFFVNRFKGSVPTKPSEQSHRLRLSLGPEDMTMMESQSDPGSFITYAWELWVTLRKYGMVLAAKFTTTESESGIFAHMVIITAFLLSTCIFKPYMDPALNWLEIFTLLCSLCTIVSVMLLSYDSDGDHNGLLHPIFYWINVSSLYVGSIVCLIFGVYKIITTWVDLGSQERKISPPSSELGDQGCTQVEDILKEGERSVSQEEKHYPISDKSWDHTKVAVQYGTGLEASTIGRSCELSETPST